MPFEVGEFEQLKLQLRRLGNITEVTNQEMKAMAVELQQKAKNMAPRDYEDLMDAIQIRETAGQGAGGRFVKGVRNYEVYINNQHPVKDPDRKGVDHVGAYAWYVHEHMGWASAPKPFMPNKDRTTGPNGEERGGMFMERAALELDHYFHMRLATVVRKYIEAMDI